MAGKRLTIEQILTMLAGAPGQIAASTSGLSAEELRTAPQAGEWSANEVLAHLRSCGDVWGGCITRILAEDQPTLRAIDPRSWMKQTNYLDLDFATSLQAYTAQREGLLATLEALSPEGWGRVATVTGAGAVLVRTVEFYAHWMAKHERPHLKQIARALSR